MKLRRNKLVPIRFDNAKPPEGLESAKRTDWFEPLEMARAAMLQEDGSAGSFLRLPQDTLAEYESNRQDSPLGQLFRCATRMHAIADRVVVLGDTSVRLGAEAILDSCCQPYWNDLTRADRGSKPRMFFDGHFFDNDATQALLHLLDSHKQRPATDELTRWGLILIDRDHSRPETLGIFRHYLRALDASCDASRVPLHELLLVVTQAHSPIHKMVSGLPVKEVWFTPESVSRPYDFFSWSGLVPAAMLGVNVIELLQGAASASSRFRGESGLENCVSNYVVDRMRARLEWGIDRWRWQRCHLSLRGFENWYSYCIGSLSARALDEFRSCEENVPFEESVAIGDLESREQPVLLQQLHSGEVRFDMLYSDPNLTATLAESNAPAVAFADLADRRMADELAGFGRLGHSVGNRISLPRVDELGIGQLVQMMLLARELEKRMVRSFVSGFKIS
jgi:glucose-6-phosphate isomerase